jgi:hypothetical protein
MGARRRLNAGRHRSHALVLALDLGRRFVTTERVWIIPPALSCRDIVERSTSPAQPFREPQRAAGILPAEEAWLCRRDVGSTLQGRTSASRRLMASMRVAKAKGGSPKAERTTTT